MRWLEEKTPVAEEAVQEVVAAAKEVEPETLHPMCLERHLNLKLAMTSRVRKQGQTWRHALHV